LYTRCPHCLTVFMLTAEQLKAAHGNVRCGTCLESFDAIPYLSDGPVSPDSEPTGALADAAPGTVPGPDPAAAPDAHHRDEPAPVVSDSRSASEKLSTTLDAARAVTSPGASGDGGAHLESGEGERISDDPPGAVHEPADALPGDLPAPRSARVPGRVTVIDEPEADADPALPEVLRGDAEAFSAESAARRRNLAYGIAALALVALLAGQYLFFMPEDAARRYPQFRGAIESICVQVGCVLPERRDPGRIRVLSRDVRVHPKFEGAMQIKATLANAAPFRQPYPQVRFTLFNVNGQTIASRVFEPSEYLGRPVAASARLRPQTPFQVELDVLAPGEAAVSFEFQFL
jgi:predicted Zn finger-like uncharacterized protein